MGHAAGLFPALARVTLEDELKGRILIEELNCAACHTADPSLVARSKKSPRLAEVGSRVNPDYLVRFLADPHGVKPGTTMPDVLGTKSAEERRDIALSLTHFLMSVKSNDFVLRAPDAVAAMHGKKLFHSRGCAACHSPRDDRGVELSPETSVPLGALEGKYSFKSLVEFLRQPHATRPSGRMPDLRLPGQELERIAHYLLQHTRVPGRLSYTLYRGQVWEGLGSDQVEAERAGLVEDFSLTSLGRVEHHTAIRYEGWLKVTEAGRHAFQLTMNGGSLRVDGKLLIQLEPSDRRGVKVLDGEVELTAGWHALQLTYFHTGHDPRFRCEMTAPGRERAPIPASLLSISSEPIPVREPFRVDAERAARGRGLFGSMGCAQCHEDLNVARTPAVAMGQLTSGRGCLGDNPGSRVRYGVTSEQRRWIAAALPRVERVLSEPRRRLDQTLVQFQCLACHDRAGLGEVEPERRALFTGTQPDMGDQGRLPPPLTHVGAKLTAGWMRDVMLNGARQRRYVNAAMPQFGEAQVGHLVELFGQLDKLEAAPRAAETDPAESKKVGHELVGSGGMSCISCHEFNGQKSGEVSAVDLARVTERLQKNWFHLYLRQPARFHPTVIMPSYWPDGVSVRPNLLGGDVARQIEAIWNYLEEGPRARKPVGLSRESNEIRVGAVTEMCRGQSPVGYRGIGVGYPERLNLAFDAGEMALRQLWKGEFASVNFGHFHPRGTDVIAFPPGIPFHRLPSMDEHWPYKGKSNHGFPQDHGYQFRGYHLDAARRPTFLYRYGDVAVEDYFEDVREPGGAAFLRRTMRFDAPAPQVPFHFRAAGGRQIQALSETEFLLEKLRVRIRSRHIGVVRNGDPSELLIPLVLEAGRSTLTMEYQW